MFSILRFILIVGAIFYYSPVRERGGSPASIESLLGWTKNTPAPQAAAPAPTTPDRLETMWRVLPESAKQAVLDKILTTSGLGLPAGQTADTLRPEERQPGYGNKPRI